MTNQFLVTGATGNVGGALVSLLVQAKKPVIAATRKPDSYPATEGVTVRKFDYDDSTTYEPLFEGVTRAFFIPKSGDLDGPDKMERLFVAAIAQDIEHIVFMTAMDQGEGTTMDDAEKRLRVLSAESGVSYTLLRPSWFMQNFSTGFTAMMNPDRNISFPAADARTSHIDARDIAAVAFAALTQEEHRNQEYVLSGAEALTYNEAAQIIRQVTGRNVKYNAISETAWRERLERAGWSAFLVGYMVDLFVGVRQGTSSTVVSTVRDILDREPISFAQFVEDYKDVWN